ncbi:MAG: hypothetical protein WCD31_00310, partial [Gillisia sp.]
SHNHSTLNNTFNEFQIRELKSKLRNIKSVQLEKEKLPAGIKINGFTSKEVSFPIIQIGKDSIKYAFQYEKFNHSKNWGRILICKKESRWDFFGYVEVPLFGYSQRIKDIQHLPDEYQIINILLLGQDENLRKKFIQVPEYLKQDGYFKSFLDFSTWESLQTGFFNTSHIDFKSVFNKTDLQKIVDYLNISPRGRIKAKMLLGNLKISKSSKDNFGIFRLTKPLIFLAKSKEKYAFLYWEKVNGPENGSGNIVLFHFNHGRWEIIMQSMLWIS